MMYNEGASLRCVAVAALCIVVVYSYSCEGPQDMWSDDQTVYCCIQESKGCPPDENLPTAAGATDSYACQAGSDWSEAEKDWCCVHKSIGCPSVDEFANLKTDCRAGLDDWQDLWSTWKMRWCCKHEKLGCPITTTSVSTTSVSTTSVSTTTTTTAKPHFDCQAGLKRWDTGWSQAKKDYCCKHEVVCASATTSECTVGKDDMNAWPITKRVWCCNHEKVGCDTHHEFVTPKPEPEKSERVDYDCHSGISAMWPRRKRDICCLTESIGCKFASTRLPKKTTTKLATTTQTFAPPTLAPTPKPTLEPTLVPTPDPTHMPTLAPTAAPTRTPTSRPTFTPSPVMETAADPYDCRMGLATWSDGWADRKKKEWCCAHRIHCAPESDHKEHSLVYHLHHHPQHPSASESDHKEHSLVYHLHHHPSAHSCAAYGCDGYKSGRPCQCNNKCKHYGNCCSDYHDTCNNHKSEMVVHKSNDYCERCPVGSCDKGPGGTCTWYLENGKPGYHCRISSCRDRPRGQSFSGCWTFKGQIYYSIAEFKTPCVDKQKVQATSAVNRVEDEKVIDSDPYNCVHGVENPALYWTVARRLWCCKHRHAGCLTASELMTKYQDDEDKQRRTAWLATALSSSPFGLLSTVVLLVAAALALTAFTAATITVRLRCRARAQDHAASGHTCPSSESSYLSLRSRLFGPNAETTEEDHPLSARVVAFAPGEITPGE